MPRFRDRITFFSRDSIRRHSDCYAPFEKKYSQTLSSIVRAYTVRELTVVYAATWIQRKTGDHHRAWNFIEMERIFIPYDCFRSVRIEPIKRETINLYPNLEKSSIFFPFFRFYGNINFTNFSPRFLFENDREKRYFDSKKWLSEIK